MVAPTPAELTSVRAVHTGSTSMQKSDLRKSGSHWGAEHIEALHVHRFDDIELNRFFGVHMPTDNDPDFIALRSDLIAATYENMKRGELGNHLRNNLFFQFFIHLSKAMTTGQAEDEDDDTSDVRSTPTGSSAEEEPEKHSELALHDLVGQILGQLDESLNQEWRLQVSDDNLSTRLRIGANPRHLTLKKAVNDGGIVLARTSPATGSLMPGRIPIVSFEAKPRRLGVGLHYQTNQPEPYNEPTFAQELAELLGQAFECSQGNGGDHDGWLITLHGTRLRLVHANFSEQYLKQVNSRFLRADQKLLVWRSKQFNLKYPDGREDALKALIALIRSLKAGAFANGQLAKALGI
ncbi:hypothetical protein FQN55_008549 [Onygenales sp. PD_40]|nr:hypothetical protein FQN55_008549 [Onygenales sp. PD_40]KAK2785591.1 hypothetical protein FQN52_008370 [Onygenales sp. PD_12]KAK2806250.1 hypothetical protein FQN51_007291 [Onygenales sp. PD_10]